MKTLALRQLIVLIIPAILVSCAEEAPPAQSPVEADIEAVTAEVATETEQQLVARARGIHDRAVTLDTHADINTSNFTESNNYTMELDTQVTLPKMQAGGLDVAWFIVYTGQGSLDQEGYDAAYANAIDKFDAIHRLAEEIAPDQIEIATSSADVRRIIAAGKKVAMIGIENAYPIAEDIGRVKEFYDRGGRYMSLAHNGHNQLSDSNTGERDGIWMHDGLSDLGRQAIMEMNKWGIMIDISHPSRDSILQTIELSRAPVIASHSSARNVNDVSRNLDDEQLLALKANGGVVQTVAFRSYLNSEKNSANRAALAQLTASIAADLGFELPSPFEARELNEVERALYVQRRDQVGALAAARMEQEVNAIAPPVDVADFVDHIDYLVELIGLEHVGISSDFDGGGGIEGWNDASETFNVTLELVRRGYNEEQIGLLWSGNLLRVLDDVERIASEIQEEA